MRVLKKILSIAIFVLAPSISMAQQAWIDYNSEIWWYCKR